MVGIRRARYMVRDIFDGKKNSVLSTELKDVCTVSWYNINMKLLP